MTTIEIPESLRTYYGNKAVCKAVDDLVGKLNKAGMPDCDWDEAKNYNQALLMAAQVRADYVALLFDLWDATFGEKDPQRLKGECFDYDQLSPNSIWDERYLWRSYYRDDLDEDGRWDDLSVYMDKAKLELRVYRYDVNSGLDYSETPNLERWSTEQDGSEHSPFLANKSVSTEEFLNEPKQVIDRFAEDADKIIQVLLKT